MQMKLRYTIIGVTLLLNLFLTLTPFIPGTAIGTINRYGLRRGPRWNPIYDSNGCA